MYVCMYTGLLHTKYPQFNKLKYFVSLYSAHQIYITGRAQEIL